MKAAPLRLRHFACSAQFAYLAHLGAFSARVRTGRPPSLSTVERNRQRGSRAARAEVAPWEHREAMWANRFRVHCPNPRNVAGQRRHRRWPTAQFVVNPPLFEGIFARKVRVFLRNVRSTLNLFLDPRTFPGFSRENEGGNSSVMQPP